MAATGATGRGKPGRKPPARALGRSRRSSQKRERPAHAGAPPIPAVREVEDVPGLDDLADALLLLRTRDECRRFLRDLCTLGELEALAHRWQIARLAAEGVPYLEIADRVQTSTATVTRVAQWLRHGAGGYAIVLERAAKKRR